MNIKRNLPCFILILLIWISVFSLLPNIFKSQAIPLYDSVSINDSYLESTVLKPKDTLTQSFLLTQDSLETIALAFTYDSSVAEKSTLNVSFYMDNKLLIEQPLPLYACPQSTFLNFALDVKDCKNKLIDVVISNTSETSECEFSIMTTTNYYKYKDYTKNYLLNDIPQEGSILCSFTYKTGIHYYKGMTASFLVIITSLIITKIIWLGWTWLQRHMNR